MPDRTPGAAQGGAGGIRLKQRAGRWVLLATVLGSSMAMLDGTVVNIALPTIGKSLGASLAGLQWTVTAYTLTLAGLILLGGSLGDRLGRRRVFVTGVVWFAIASALCGLAPNIGVLIGARALQGVGGALLAPGSLAIIQATFDPRDRPRAVGAWSGLGGVAGAVGPFLGGWIVQSIGWRWIFLINLPVAVAVVAVTTRHVPETSDPSAHGRFDILGAALAALALGGITYALIEASGNGAIGGGVLTAAAAGLVAAAAFVLVERRRSRSPERVPPMLPLDVFALTPVHRRQRGDLRDLRRAERHAVPAGARASAGVGLLTAAGRRRPAAVHPADAAAFRASGGAGAADRAAVADDVRRR